jgi:hypothetical protein
MSPTPLWPAYLREPSGDSYGGRGTAHLIAPHFSGIRHGGKIFSDSGPIFGSGDLPVRHSLDTYRCRVACLGRRRIPGSASCP